MLIFPATDVYEGKVVRLYKGDYGNMTVYSTDPVEVVRDFVSQGAKQMHLVDLEGARYGKTAQIDILRKIKAAADIFVEVGGGIRQIESIERYIDAGADRVILGTAAAEQEGFVQEAVASYGEKIAVGIDIRDGFVAVKGWTSTTSINAVDFAEQMQGAGVSTIICTDISRDGAMAGTNKDLYHTLSSGFRMNIIASGGVSSLQDITDLRKMDLYGAIVGKAYYEGAFSLKEAIRIAG